MKLHTYRMPMAWVPQYVLLLLILAACIAITLSQHWETTHESWLYWFFARLLTEGGGFVIPDRSPFYIVYLLLFRPLGYPTMVIVEYAVTLLLGSVMLVVFLKRYISPIVAVFGVILWLPYFQISEPSVQLLALALTLGAVRLRENKNSRQEITWSYVLFFCAYLTRGSYIAVLLLFALWDLVHLNRNRINSKPILKLRNYWPNIALVIVFLIVIAFQSAHSWNNVWATSTTWFPSTGKQFNIFQNYNASYILEHYGQYQDHDFYESNKEVFGGADTTFEAIRANPDFVKRIAWEYTKVGLIHATNLTRIPSILQIPDLNIFQHLSLLICIFAGAFLCSKSTYIRLYVLGVVFMMILTFFFLPNKRYFIVLVPILIMAAAWYARSLLFILDASLKLIFRKHFGNSLSKILLTTFSTLLIILFSSGSTTSDFSGVFQATWSNLLSTFVVDYKSGNLRILEFRDTSIYFPPMKSVHTELFAHAKGCRGIMTLEHTFLAAFTQTPLNRIYDIWEIPPFSSFDDPTSPYKGLRPERVSCLFISKNLKYGVGSGTNSQIRYENYIEPYALQLLSRGGKTVSIDGYGDLIIYN